MAELPAEVLEAVVARLYAHDTVRLGATCRGFRALAREATPGLLLSLYPHQARSWRIGDRVRERGRPCQKLLKGLPGIWAPARSVPHPTCTRCPLWRGRVQGGHVAGKI